MPRFRTTIELGGKTATGFAVPEEIVSSFESGKKPKVYVTINNYTYRSTVATLGGRFMLPLSAEHREGAGVAAGDEVEVELQLDTEPREVAVPEDFANALEQAPDAKAVFEKFSYSHQLRYVLQIEGAKTPETRQRRIEKTITDLREGKK